MEIKALTQEETNAKAHAAFIWGIHVFLGSLFLAILSQIKIPIGPVPITMQTLGIFLLGFFQGGKKGMFSVCLYLGEATLGLPVLSGWSSNPLWIIGSCGGYLFSFPLAAYAVGKMASYQKHPRFLWLLLCAFLGQGVIYLFGIIWLTFFMSIKDVWLYGVIPFLWIAFLKSTCAAALRGGYLIWKR